MWSNGMRRCCDLSNVLMTWVELFNLLFGLIDLFDTISARFFSILFLLASASDISSSFNLSVAFNLSPINFLRRWLIVSSLNRALWKTAYSLEDWAFWLLSLCVLMAWSSLFVLCRLILPLDVSGITLLFIFHICFSATDCVLYRCSWFCSLISFVRVLLL